MQGKFSQIGKAYVRQLEQVKRIHSRLGSASRNPSAVPDSPACETSIPGGDHRALVTRPQREDIPMVPGPEEIQ